MTALVGIVSSGLTVVACGPPGPRGEKGDKGGDWAREEVYCKVGERPDSVTGVKVFGILVSCGDEEFPLSGSCHTGKTPGLSLLGGEHEFWHQTDAPDPRFECTFEWTMEPPYPSPFDSKAKAEICCVRNKQIPSL